ncbi:MAG: hypothetical protein M3478_11230 [Planctomycetota bacterium]|nr:hypothetical protein [Planctomycetota bacterium]
MLGVLRDVHAAQDIVQDVFVGWFAGLDYAKQARLVVRLDDKVAVLQDLRNLYTTDEKTGQVKSTELGTHARDDVLRTPRGP